MPPFDTDTTPGSFGVSAQIHPDGLLLCLVGEFDLTGVARFEEVFDAALEAEAEDADEPAEIILDFAQLAFIDSSGIAAIIRSLGRLRRAGRPLGACGLGGQVERVLAIVEVLPRLTIVERPTTLVAWPEEV